VFDIYTIIFLALAVFIFFRLRSVLGQRTGSERPPADPYAGRERPGTVPNGDGKVVALPTRQSEPAPAPVALTPAERWKGIAEAGSPVSAGLDAILERDTGFDARHFVAGARAAYEMVVMAFAEGDRKTLKSMLSKEVFDGFDGVIRDRESRNEQVETKFVSIDKADIVGAEMKGPMAQLTLRFVSQLISATRDKAGTVVDGNPEKVTSITDVWTFARDVTSRDPNWKLVATEAGA
jgi:predicted lipid-binding transport protein (Tim44 family)